MQTFKQFLTEISYSDITIEEAARLIKQNCSEYCKFSFPIYRGIDSKKGVMLGNSAEGKDRRSSSLKSNIYTNFFDKSPMWEGFPKRSKSFICTTADGTANSYGEVYRVFPYDDAKIAMVPNHDIWYAFKDVFDIALSNVQEYITTYITDIYAAMGITPVVKVFNDDLSIADVEDVLVIVTDGGLEAAAMTFSNRVKDLAAKDRSEWTDDDRNYDYWQRICVKLLTILEDNGCTNYWQLFNKKLTPEKFQVLDARHAKSFKDVNDNELYIEGQAIFINEQMVQPLLDHLRI